MFKSTMYNWVMRIWDLEPSYLCRKHLLGEHRELHALWTVISQGKKGYSNHPETKRWVGKLAALFRRHDDLVKEMRRRSYNHFSDLDKSLAVGLNLQDDFLVSAEEQKKLLKDKGCSCGGEFGAATK